MKISFCKQLVYADVDRQFNAKLSALFQLLQEAGASHSEQVGSGIKVMHENGYAWVLNRFKIIVNRYPIYSEKVEAITWSRGAQQYKGLRDYYLYSDQEQIAKATSEWFYYDMNQEKIIPIPNRINEIYTIEADCAFDDPIKIKPMLDFNPEYNTDITLRCSDYDSTNHVNNTIYMDFISTALDEFGSGHIKVKHISLQFCRAITIDHKIISVAVQACDKYYFFEIFNNETLFARGVFTLFHC